MGPKLNMGDCVDGDESVTAGHGASSKLAAELSMTPSPEPLADMPPCHTPDGPEDQLQKRLREEAQANNPNRKSSKGLYASIQEITQIRPYLLLCGATALRGSVLTDLGVSAVVNATQELPDTPLPDDDILYLRVGVGDSADTDILSWMDIVADLIHQVRMSGGRTLIHCVAGVSRSAALCLAYLVKYEQLSLLEAYHHVKSLRHIVRPNHGFFGQLVEFEGRVSGRQTVPMVYCDIAHSCIPCFYQDDYRRQMMRRLIG